jgi:hypothetical protein
VLPQAAIAETIWCSKLGIGCPSEEDKQRTLKDCENYANQEHRDHLRKAAIDETVWQDAGALSAQDYAKSMWPLFYAACIKFPSNLRD